MKIITTNKTVKKSSNQSEFKPYTIKEELSDVDELDLSSIKNQLKYFVIFLELESHLMMRI